MEPLANANVASKRKFNFEHAFRPIYHFSRLAGLWPFSIIHDSNGTIQRARIGPFNIMWSILIICLNLVSLLDTYRDLRAQQGKNTIRIYVAAFTVFQFGSFLFTTIRISLDLINRKRLIGILRAFNTFDSEVRFFFKDFYFQFVSGFVFFLLQQMQLSKFGVNLDNKKDCRRAWLSCMTTTLLLLFFLIFHAFELFILHEDLWLILDRFGHNLIYFVMWIPPVVSSLFLIHGVRERFAVLNVGLRYFSQSILLYFI